MPVNLPAAAMLALAICNATQVQQPSTALMIAPSREVQTWQPPICDAFEQTNSNHCDACQGSSLQLADDSSSRSGNPTVAQKQARRSLSNRKKMKQKNRNHSVAQQCPLRKSSKETKPVIQAPKAKAFSAPSVAKIVKNQENESPFKAKQDRCNKAKNECIELQTSLPNGDTARGLWNKMHMTSSVKRVINGMNIDLETLGHAARCYNEFENCMKS